MSLEDYIREMSSINRQLSWLHDAVGTGLPTEEQLAEKRRLTKLAEELTSKVPVMFGSQLSPSRD